MSDDADRPDPEALAELAARVPPDILFGTSSWTYPGWKGLVYHREYKGRGTAAPMLEEYARFPLFRTVGIDSSFYAPPTDATLEAYAKHLPPGFPCVSKVWHEITVHTWTRAQSRDRAGERNAHFLDADLFMEAVYQPYRLHFAGHAGPFVFEFQAIPAANRGGLSPEEFADALDGFFERLPHDAPYAVEIRNPEFLTPRYFAVLREHGVAHLFNSWTRMPPVGEQLDLQDSVTGRFLVVRALLRPGRTYDEAVDAFAPYDRIQEPLPELRRDLVRLIRTALALRLPAYVIVNNRAEGSAPLTIVAIAKLLIEQMARAEPGPS